MKRILLFLVAFCLLGCDPTVKTAFLRSYVMYYYDVEKIKLVGWADQKAMRILFTNPLPVGNYQSTGNEKKAYDALCVKHNDMTYNRDFIIWDNGPHETKCLAVDFVSIDFVSDADFDDEHLAGSSLSDIIRFDTYSLKPYIESGYKPIADVNYDYFSIVEGLLSELAPNNLLTLLGHPYYNGAEIELSFIREPTLEKTHTFTVTMTPDDGREPFTASIEMTFD